MVLRNLNYYLLPMKKFDPFMISNTIIGSLLFAILVLMLIIAIKYLIIALFYGCIY